MTNIYYRLFLLPTFFSADYFITNKVCNEINQDKQKLYFFSASSWNSSESSENLSQCSRLIKNLFTAIEDCGWWELMVNYVRYGFSDLTSKSPVIVCFPWIVWGLRSVSCQKQQNPNNVYISILPKKGHGDVLGG